LLHPFLPHCFKLTGYLNDTNAFKNRKQQYQAVYLLYYLATGHETLFDETELAMSKILCGLSVEQAMPISFTLSPKEKETANELLEVLISRWKKLGKTSPEVLRNSFLKRSGLLENKDKAYHLTMETSGVDALLDFIPWDIKMIKLPWLDQLIYVSWR